jgi:glucosamine--fructose-6-phosphate aminotransferase (isomerizing)
MCGIVGYIGTSNAEQILLEGLKAVSYRGYDSAGIATLDSAGNIVLRRAEGNLQQLTTLLAQQPAAGTIGIGHTRWATHGKPNEQNAHPQVAGRVAVVHNGIIENFAELRRELEHEGRHFSSETDTEVIPHLIDRHLEEGLAPIDAVRKTVERLKGSFAIAVLIKGMDRSLIVARKKAPLLIGFGEYGTIIGSDPLSFVGTTASFFRLKDGDIVRVEQNYLAISDANEFVTTSRMSPIPSGNMRADKGDYRHFMEKEIHEQPEAIADTLSTVTSPLQSLNPERISRISIVACGTAYYAGLIAKHWIETLAVIPVECEAASEFLYRRMIVAPGQIGVVISQSGETADTIAALRKMKEEEVPTIAIVNAPGSTMTELADRTIYTVAWPEIAVASTKAFTAQLAVLARIAIAIAHARQEISPAHAARLNCTLENIPSQIKEVISLEKDIEAIARSLAAADSVFYIGRGTNHSIALEGALKLKEVAYIHAEACAAGELKHGPLALIDENIPTIVIAPRDQWFGKTASNMEEIAARGGKIVLLSDKEGCKAMECRTWKSIVLPTMDPLFAPIGYAVAVQMIAYHVALAKGVSIDQPKNLAKSVTVE